MNDELYDKLRDFEYAFTLALKSSSIPAFTRGELAILDEAYEALGYTKPKSHSCGYCNLTEVKLIAVEYYKYNYGREQQENNGSGDGDVEQTGTTNTEKQDINSSKKDNITRRSGKRNVSKSNAGTSRK